MHNLVDNLSITAYGIASDPRQKKAPRSMQQIEALVSSAQALIYPHMTQEITQSIDTPHDREIASASHVLKQATRARERSKAPGQAPQQARDQQQP